MIAPLAGAVAFAVFVWWFSTGLVLLLNRLSRTGRRASLALSTLVLAGALVGLAHAAPRTDTASAYCAFTCALLAWGWIELSFLTGWVTGPQRSALTRGARGWARLSQSVRAILWHELGILAVGGAILGISWGEPNLVGLGTFAVLWVMRTSAKINLFLGVRNLSEEFLPPHLAYLQSFFRRSPMNAFWPLSVAGALGALALLVQAVVAAGHEPGAAVGLTLVATLLALAIAEHLMLVLPLDTTALWRWAIRQGSRRDASPQDERPMADAAARQVAAAGSIAPGASAR